MTQQTAIALSDLDFVSRHEAVCGFAATSHTMNGSQMRSRLGLAEAGQVGGHDRQQCAEHHQVQAGLRRRSAARSTTRLSPATPPSPIAQITDPKFAQPQYAKGRSLAMPCQYRSCTRW